MMDRRVFIQSVVSGAALTFAGSAIALTEAPSAFQVEYIYTPLNPQADLGDLIKLRKKIERYEDINRINATFTQRGIIKKFEEIEKAQEIIYAYTFSSESDFLIWEKEMIQNKVLDFSRVQSKISVHEYDTILGRKGLRTVMRVG